MPSPAHQDATIFEVIKTSMRGADGHITSVLSMGRNIKARKDTEARLRDATEQLELALMGADLGRWDHDLSVEKGYYLDERSCAMLGRDALESTHGRAWGHLTHHDDLPGTLDAMRAHLSGAVPAYEAEYQARHTSGHWVWMGNRGKAVQFSQNGKPLRMVGTLMNISKRKQVEGELLATQSELQSTLKAEVAQRLQQCIRAIDTVARLGGDEFVVLIQNLSVDHGDAKLHAATVGHKILFSLNEPYQLKDVEHNTTPSIGATLFLGRATVGADLLKQADMAMYEAKAQGRNTLCLFQERGL